MASSNDKINICGVWIGSRSPGMCVASFEQKHSGSWHTDVSQGSAAFGSAFGSQYPSSEPSAQSIDLQNARIEFNSWTALATHPSQKYSLGKQTPSAHPSWAELAQGAWCSKGFGTLVSAVKSQFSTLALKSQICRETSNRSPAEHLNSKTSPSRQR